jgi:hypothetical protein
MKRASKGSKAFNQAPHAALLKMDACPTRREGSFHKAVANLLFSRI